MAFNAKTNWKINEYVQPDDMNRIEMGIQDVDTNKADSNMSNVPNASFSIKAKSSGMDVPPSGDITYYVSVNGNDTTGDGTADRPFKTLQKAVDSFPHSNPLGSIYYIIATEGTYDGFVLRANKNIWISAIGSVYIGRILLYNGFVHIQDKLTLNDSVFVFNTATLIVKEVAIDRTSGSGEPGVTCQYGGRFIVTYKLFINNVALGIDCLLAQAFINEMEMTGGSTGISCGCGQVNLGNEQISATTKYAVTNSGRIFIGSQTILQQ